MLQLIAALVGLLADIVIFWAVPIVGAALFSAVSAIIIAINPLVGAAVILATALLLIAYCLHQHSGWQTIMWGALLVPYGVLAPFVPHWAVLWGLTVSLLALGVLLIPGAILPHARSFLTTVLLAVVGLHAVLAFTVWGKGEIFLVVIGLLTAAGGSLIFSQGARPWEVRRAQRVAGRLVATVGMVLIVLGLIAPRLSVPSINISAPRPLSSVWEAVSSYAEMWALRSQRSLLGERAKTRSLEELENELRHSHWERWRKNIQQVPNTPLTQGEWKELRVERNP